MLALYTGKERPERDRIARYNDIACARTSYRTHTHNLRIISYDYRYTSNTVDLTGVQQQKRT